jgi:predicted nucleic acid-binding protein
LMATLIDTSLWIDLTRARSPRALKAFIAPYVNDPEACLAEPIVFEVLRSATDAEAQRLTRQFETMPLLASPVDLWSRGVELGRTCRRAGLIAGSLDLLIAAVALYHTAELVTFDAAFRKIGVLSGLRVSLLKKPTP